jgi:outer membrane protein TolC
MDLKEMVKYGLKNSPNTVIYEEKKRSYELQLQGAKSKILPKVTGDFNTSTGGSTNTDTKLYSAQRASSAGIKITQPLWDGGLKLKEIDAAEISDRIGSIESKESRDQFIFDVISSFIKYSESLVLVEAEETQFQLINDQERVSRSAYLQGLKPPKDYMRVKGELKRSEISLADAKSRKESLRKSLLSLVGLNTEENTLPAIDALKIDANLPSALIKVTPHVSVPILQKHELLQEKESIELALAQKKHRWPSIDLQATGGYQINDFITPDAETPTSKSYYWSAALGVSYPIWDWGSSSKEIEATISNHKSNRAAREIAEADIKLKISQMKDDISKMEHHFKMSRELLKIEEDGLRATSQDYQQGRAAHIEVIDSTQKTLESRIEVARSYFTWLKTSWECKLLEGNIYDAFETL